MTQTPITPEELNKLIELNNQGIDGLMAKHAWDRLTHLVGEADVSDMALQGFMLHTMVQWVNHWMIDSKNPSDLGRAFRMICERLHQEFNLGDDIDQYCQADLVFNDILNHETVPYFKTEGYHVDRKAVLNAGLSLVYKMAGVIQSYEPKENRLVVCLNKLLEENNA